MKIAVFGNYGVRNLGDDLILKGLLKHPDLADAELLVFCGRPEGVEQHPRVSARAFFPGGIRSLLSSLISPASRRQVQQALSELKACDHIIIGGGGILVDRRIKAQLLWWRQLQMIRSSGRPFSFLGNSLELKKKFSEPLFKPYLQAAKRITVRDSASAQQLERWGISSELVDDLSYYVDLQALAAEEQQPITGSDQPLLALALCRWGLKKKHKKSLKKFLSWARSQGYQVIGLAFQQLEDDDRELYRELDEQLPVLTDPADIMTALIKSDVVLAMRLHAVICAHRLQKPLVAISYQDKVRHFLQDRGHHEQLIELPDLNLKKLQELFGKAVAGQGKSAKV